MELWGEFNSSVLLMREDVEGNKTAETLRSGGEIIEAENNPNLYEIQDRTYNRSHITEE